MDSHNRVQFPGPAGNPKKDDPNFGDRIKLAAANPVFILLTVLACVLVAYGIYLAAGDPQGDRSWSMITVLLAPSLPIAWSMLQLIWNSKRPELMLLDAFLRCVVVPVFTVLPTLVVAVITVLLPSVQGTIEATRYGEYGTHYYFSLRDGSPLTVVLTGSGILGYAGAVLTGLVLLVFAVLPAMAFGNPKKFAQVNQLEPGEEFAKSNAVASKALSVFLMLTFLIPTMIVFGKGSARGASLGEALRNTLSVFTQPYPESYIGDIIWVIGAVLIPVGGAAFIIAKLFQKPKVHRPAFSTLEDDMQTESLNESPADRTRNEK